MQALRQRAACAARRAKPSSPRTWRSYASESHGHDHHHHAAPQVEEGLGTAFYIFAAFVPASALAYSISRPGKDGEPSRFSKWLRTFDYFNDWEERNSIRTQMIEQAADDKHLFLNSDAGRKPHVELKTPELIGTGSPWNVPAGHYPKLDHVTEHYRQKYAEEEERKAKKLQQKKEEQQS